MKDEDSVAQEEAAQLARQIGDEEWEQGNTKYALESWEASEVNLPELLGLAQKLLRAEEVVPKVDRSLHATYELPAGRPNHVNFSKLCAKDGCIRCKTQLDVLEAYDQETCNLLGFKKGIATSKFHPMHRETRSRYRAAAVACLKLIKRMR